MGEHISRIMGSWLLLLAANAIFAQPSPRDFDAEIENAIGLAKEAAGFEYLGVLNRLCVLPPSLGENTSNNVPAYVADPALAPPRESWYADPVQVFDELYWLGGAVHSAWLLTTSEGYILFDTQYLYNSGELILDGMRKLGLDPAEIRYILITQAHGDHIGGVELVQAASGAPVIMGKADWDMVRAYPNRYASMTPNFENGIEVSENMSISLGGTTVEIYPTPGHTKGTLSFLFPVHDFGRTLVVSYSGGTAFNFPTATPDPGIANLDEYIASQRMFAEKSAEAGATVLLTNHSEFDDAHDKARMIPGRGFGPNPFVSSPGWVDRYYDVMIHCAEAKMIGLEKLR
jgi:metallo-beta-lactamase class B